ncbi:hypothetical protein BV20DRAFT_165567 [Pilatotrama ljubarskyi]|nr:hypothetical protein BV20DRAFT_165567 [Pilatotrama ljubarskyi]
MTWSSQSEPGRSNDPSWSRRASEQEPRVAGKVRRRTVDCWAQQGVGVVSKRTRRSRDQGRCPDVAGCADPRGVANRCARSSQKTSVTYTLRRYRRTADGEIAWPQPMGRSPLTSKMWPIPGEDTRETVLGSDHFAPLEADGAGVAKRRSLSRYRTCNDDTCSRRVKSVCAWVVEQRLPKMGSQPWTDDDHLRVICACYNAHNALTRGESWRRIWAQHPGRYCM